MPKNYVKYCRTDTNRLAIYDSSFQKKAVIARKDILKSLNEGLPLETQVTSDGIKKSDVAEVGGGINWGYVGAIIGAIITAILGFLAVADF